MYVRDDNSHSSLLVLDGLNTFSGCLRKTKLCTETQVRHFSEVVKSAIMSIWEN